MRLYFDGRPDDSLHAEGLRALRELQQLEVLTADEFVAAKALLMNFDLEVAGALQRFHAIRRRAELSEGEFVLAKLLLLQLPTEEDRRRMVTATATDSAYERRRLQQEAVLEQMERGWRLYAMRYVSREGRRPIHVPGIGGGLTLLLGVAMLLFAYLMLGVQAMSPWWCLTLLPAAAIFAFSYLLDHGYRRDLALYQRLRAEVANGADLPV